MANYKVEVEEVLFETFEVEADNADEAEQIIKDKYTNGEIVLENGANMHSDYAIRVL